MYKVYLYIYIYLYSIPLLTCFRRTVRLFCGINFERMSELFSQVISTSGVCFPWRTSTSRKNVYRSSEDVNLEGGIMIGKGSRGGSEKRITSERMPLRWTLLDSTRRFWLTHASWHSYVPSRLLRDHRPSPTSFLNELHDDYTSVRCCRDGLIGK